MIPATRRLPVVIVTMLAIALTAVACGQGTASPGSSAVTSPSSAPSLATPAPTPAASATPSGSEAPSPSPSAATACTTLPAAAALPSDRFTDVTVTPGATSDRLTFVFGNGSLSAKPGLPQGALQVARPPYSQAGSGAAIDMAGDHVLKLTFTGMSLQNDAGQETYSGSTTLKPLLRALQQAVLFDASEGVVGWYIGYDGEGCVRLANDGPNVTLTIDHS
jgi:hypothetical protein